MTASLGLGIIDSAKIANEATIWDIDLERWMPGDD